MPRGALPPTFHPEVHPDRSAVRRMSYAPLGDTDMVVSAYGIGGSAFTSAYCSTVSYEETRRILLSGLREGVNYVDTAPWYGQGRSEEFIGRALEGVPRRAYYIATKVGRYDKETGTMFDFSRAKVRSSVEESLGRLRVDCVDLVQVHDVEFCASLEQLVKHTLPELQEMKKAGKARYVGITGYNLGVLKRLVQLSPPGTIDTVLCYSRFTLFNKDFLEAAPFFRSRGLGLINAAPIGMGLLARTIPEWHPAPDVTRQGVAAAIRHAEERGFDLPRLALKYCLSRSDSAFPVCLVSSVDAGQLERNLLAASADPSEEEDAMLRELEAGFFQFLTVSQWENLEVTRYWRKMREGGHRQNLDL